MIHYWHEENPPDHVAQTLDSFRRHNPSRDHIVFNASTAGEFIDNRYGPREATAFRACAVPAMQADYFRYCAVHSLGGVYADANFSCLGSLKGLLQGPERGILFGRQDPVPDSLAAVYSWPHPVGSFRAVTNGLFAFSEAGHPLLELAVEIATANIENRVADGPVGVWLAAGPGVFTSMYLLRELGSIDSFIEYSTNSVIEPSARLFCEVVGDQTRITRAFDGVDILPKSQRDKLAVKAKRTLGNAYWQTVGESIYR